MGWFETHKPAAPARVHLFLATLMWSVVGTVLLVTGVIWTAKLGWPTASFLLCAGALGGLLKSRLILNRAARRIGTRIMARGDGRCIGGVLSVRSWALVACMAGAGRLLRAQFAWIPALGALYVAIGIALLVSSRVVWRTRRMGHATVKQ